MGHMSISIELNKYSLSTLHEEFMYDQKSFTLHASFFFSEDSNHFLLFMKCQLSLEDPTNSHTRLFLRVKARLLSPYRQREINTPPTPLHHITAWGWERLQRKYRRMTWERKKVQEEYCEWDCIVSTRPKPKTNTRYVTKSSGLASRPGVPLRSSVSTKALVFQYTVTETADTVGKCLCRARLSPSDSVSPLTSTQVPQVLRVGPAFCSLRAIMTLALNGHKHKQ